MSRLRASPGQGTGSLARRDFGSQNEEKNISLTEPAEDAENLRDTRNLRVILKGLKPLKKNMIKINEISELAKDWY